MGSTKQEEKEAPANGLGYDTDKEPPPFKKDANSYDILSDESITFFQKFATFAKAAASGNSVNKGQKLEEHIKRIIADNSLSSARTEIKTIQPDFKSINQTSKDAKPCAKCMVVIQPLLKRFEEALQEILPNNNVLSFWNQRFQKVKDYFADVEKNLGDLYYQMLKSKGGKSKGYGGDEYDEESQKKIMAKATRQNEDMINVYLDRDAEGLARDKKEKEKKAKKREALKNGNEEKEDKEKGDEKKEGKEKGDEKKEGKEKGGEKKEGKEKGGEKKEGKGEPYQKLNLEHYAHDNLLVKLNYKKLLKNNDENFKFTNKENIILLNKTMVSFGKVKKISRNLDCELAYKFGNHMCRAISRLGGPLLTFEEEASEYNAFIKKANELRVEIPGMQEEEDKKDKKDSDKKPKTKKGELPDHEYNISEEMDRFRFVYLGSLRDIILSEYLMPLDISFNNMKEKEEEKKRKKREKEEEKWEATEEKYKNEEGLLGKWFDYKNKRRNEKKHDEEDKDEKRANKEEEKEKKKVKKQQEEEQKYIKMNDTDKLEKYYKREAAKQQEEERKEDLANLPCDQPTAIRYEFMKALLRKLNKEYQEVAEKFAKKEQPPPAAADDNKNVAKEVKENINRKNCLDLLKKWRKNIRVRLYLILFKSYSKYGKFDNDYPSDIYNSTFLDDGSKAHANSALSSRNEYNNLILSPKYKEIEENPDAEVSDKDVEDLKSLINKAASECRLIQNNPAFSKNVMKDFSGEIDNALKFYPANMALDSYEPARLSHRKTSQDTTNSQLDPDVQKINDDYQRILARFNSLYPMAYNGEAFKESLPKPTLQFLDDLDKAIKIYKRDMAPMYRNVANPALKRRNQNRLEEAFEDYLELKNNLSKIMSKNYGSLTGPIAYSFSNLDSIDKPHLRLCRAGITKEKKALENASEEKYDNLSNHMWKFFPSASSKQKIDVPDILNGDPNNPVVARSVAPLVAYANVATGTDTTVQLKDQATGTDTIRQLKDQATGTDTIRQLKDQATITDTIRQLKDQATITDKDNTLQNTEQLNNTQNDSDPNQKTQSIGDKINQGRQRMVARFNSLYPIIYGKNKSMHTLPNEAVVLIKKIDEHLRRLKTEINSDYTNNFTPAVIKRNILMLENWYEKYKECKENIRLITDKISDPDTSVNVKGSLPYCLKHLDLIDKPKLSQCTDVSKEQATLFKISKIPYTHLSNIDSKYNPNTSQML